jgi:DNA-binding NarL/FixJ family response regulator
MFARALIVDDLPAARELLKAVLAEAFPASSVCEADSVANALAQTTTFIPDLALIDLGLPDGEGTDLIRRLNAQLPGCVSIVASIHDDGPHLFAALQAGAQGYLLKDQPRDILVAQLRGISAGQPPLAPAIARRLIAHFQPERSRDKESALTLREREVLALLARSLSLGEIGEKLGISRHTVGDHVKHIYRKLCISSRAEAALQARDLGLLP